MVKSGKAELRRQKINFRPLPLTLTLSPRGRGEKSKWGNYPEII
jgi:hypothetical protein